MEEKACQCWQQRVRVLENKQTKSIVGHKQTNKKQGEMLNTTEVNGHSLFHEKAKLMIQVNEISGENLKYKEEQVTSNYLHVS